jgi:hypothetical protein
MESARKAVVPPLIDLLEQRQVAYCSIDRTKFPQEEELRNYDQQLVIEDYSTPNKQTVEVYYIRMVHRRTGQDIRIDITEVSRMDHAVHELSWIEGRSEKKKAFSLGGPIGISLSINCFDYL